MLENHLREFRRRDKLVKYPKAKENIKLVPIEEKAYYDKPINRNKKLYSKHRIIRGMARFIGTDKGLVIDRNKNGSIKYINTDKEAKLKKATFEKRLMEKYKLTIDEYNKLRTKQNDLCAICFNSNYKRQLHVDHDHNTGKVRGLLCGYCNSVLAFARDSSEILEASSRYLKSH